MAYYEDIAVADNILKCIICNEAFENNNRAIALHLDSRKHREHYMKRLMCRNSIVIKNKELFCHLCDQLVNIGGLIDHVHTSKHLKTSSLIKEILSNDGKFIEISDSHEFINCFICDSQISFQLDAVKSHLQLDKHRRARSMALQPLNGIFSVEDNDEYLWCKICQTYLDNYIEQIFQHIEESDHANTMFKLLRLINGQNITIKDYLQCSKQDKAFCTKCRIEVPCNVDNIQKHINGKKHEKS